ncbi:hypothetical protein M2199_006253 [Bradyrhizobium elkanii]|nr:hypothetical protein [Bradyrhizobium elkanii]
MAGFVVMSFAQKKTTVVPVAEERRRFQRVKVHLLGRYMLPDRREFPCQIIVSVTRGSPVPGLDLRGMLWIARSG